NRVIVFDLDGDVDALLEQTPAEIADRLYTPVADLPPGVSRVPLKEVHLNRSPMLVPWAHLRAPDFERLGIDPDQVLARAERLRAHGPELAEKARQVYAGAREGGQDDVDASLYSGFCGDGDRRLCTQVRATAPAELGSRVFDFRDPRLPELLFRYRARNWPETLTPEERGRWDDYRRRRLQADSGLSEYTFDTFFAEIATLRATHAGDGQRLVLLDQLEAWVRALRAAYEAHVRQPFLRLVGALQRAVAAISPHFRADPRPVGGSLFRIHRDARFSNDKSPYKTWQGARLFHERRREVAAPSFYIHLQPGGSFVGAGLWHPESDTQRKVRQFIFDNPESWRRSAHAPAFRRRFDLDATEVLVRTPRGFPADFEFIDDLRHRNWVFWR